MDKDMKKKLRGVFMFGIFLFFIMGPLAIPLVIIMALWVMFSKNSFKFDVSGTSFSGIGSSVTHSLNEVSSVKEKAQETALTSEFTATPGVKKGQACPFCGSTEIYIADGKVHCAKCGH